MKNTIRTVCYVVLVLQLAVAAVFGARTAHTDQPITIRSNELTADNKLKTAVFTGNVVARQGELTIYCDRMTVTYGASEGDVDAIEASGNVRIVQSNRTGFGEHARYSRKEGKVVLSGGSPRVVQGDDVISGQTITYFIQDEKSSVSGGRVEAVLHPRKAD